MATSLGAYSIRMLKDQIQAHEKNTHAVHVVTAPIQEQTAELATKHNQGKAELSLLPEIFWQLLGDNQAVSRKVQQYISKAGHATSKEDFMAALYAAWGLINSQEGTAYAAEGLAEVMAFGVNKYSRNNWKQGFKYTHMLDAALRHALWYHTCDKETGLQHWKHVIFCLMMLFHMVHNETGVNDLEWKNNDASEIHDSGSGNREQ